MTNKEFSGKDKKFIEACNLVNLPQKKHEKLGLRRQASKWRRRKGIAYKEGRYESPNS